MEDLSVRIVKSVKDCGVMVEAAIASSEFLGGVALIVATALSAVGWSCCICSMLIGLIS